MIPEIKPTCLAGIVLTIGCSSGNPGAAPCGADALECSPLALTARDAVPVEDLPELTPTWIKPLPTSVSAQEQGGDWKFAQLSSDRDGKLWLFDRDEAGVRVSRMSDDGEIQDSTIVSPPAGSKVPIVSLAVNASWETGRDPASKIVWTRGPGCDQTVDRTPGCTTDYEKLIFDRGLAEDPVRVPLVESLLADGFVNERGELFYVASTWFDQLPSVAKLDRQSRDPLWKQSDFETTSKETDLAGAAIADGRTAVMRHSSGSFLNMIIVYWLDENGNHDDDGDPAQQFAAQVDRASYRLLSTGEQPVVVYTDDIGDLHVERVRRDADNAQSVAFLREEYQYLDLRATAISPSGDVYVFTQSGRRDASHPTLCRAPADGEASCVTLPEEFRSEREVFAKLENFVARDHGVVFAQYGTKFIRLDFPR